MDVKKIYSNKKAMVSDALIESSDETINAAIKDSTVGMIIYTAGYAKAKQKSLDNTWVTIALGGGSGSGGGGGTAATDAEVISALVAADAIPALMVDTALLSLGEDVCIIG